jgi:hypothetical protein
MFWIETFCLIYVLVSVLTSSPDTPIPSADDVLDLPLLRITDVLLAFRVFAIYDRSRICAVV